MATRSPMPAASQADDHSYLLHSVCSGALLRNPSRSTFLHLSPLASFTRQDLGTVKKLRTATLGLLALAALVAVVLALPVTGWRTGRSDVEPLALASAGTHAVLGRRIWIDTDAACGADRTTDPDDCLALLALLKAPGLQVVGISTVFGNATLDVTDRTTRDLVALLSAEGRPAPPVFRGRGAHLEAQEATGPTPAEAALRSALAQAPMVVVALGPLTNIAAVLRRDGALSSNVQALVAVMGQRPGHVFHPVEGGTARILLGHGPVFKDFNFAKDRLAASELLARRVPTTLVPYEAAQALTMTGANLDAMDRAGPAAHWVAARSRAWLSFWQSDIRQAGFFSFDLAAAAYLLHPQFFRCARVRPSVEAHAWLWRWRLGDTGLFVLPQGGAVEHPSVHHVTYCAYASSALHGAALADLTMTARPR